MIGTQRTRLQRRRLWDCEWVHAHLHRVEGDLDNACYWYRQARRPPATADLAMAERRDVEVTPGGPYRIVATAVNEVRAEQLVAVAEEHVVAVPFVDAKVRIEACR
jgi:hypothetical protein